MEVLQEHDIACVHRGTLLPGDVLVVTYGGCMSDGMRESIRSNLGYAFGSDHRVAIFEDGARLSTVGP